MILINPFVLGSGAPPPSEAHRYWRVNSLSVTDSSFFEISELQLLSGGTVVSESKTYSSSVAPDGLSLSNLFDGSTSTRCYWAVATAEGAGFYIQIDLGSAIVVDGVRQAGYDTPGRHMDAFTLQYSDDASAWTTLATKTGLTYPGNNTLSSTYTVP